MNIADLTPFHLTALSNFNGKRALTETGLANALNCEKAVARHAINVLKNTGMIKKLGVYEFTITPEGIGKLTEKQLISAKVEPKTRKISTVSEAVGKMVASESTALEGIMNAPTITVQEPRLMLADLEHQQNQRWLAEDAAAREIPAEAVHDLPPANQVLVVPPEQAEAVTAQVWAGKPYSEMAKDLEGVNFSSARTTELPALDLNAPADFDTLVRQGLARLNAQLGLQPVHIENIDLKIEALSKLATSTAPISKELADLVSAISKDLHRIRYNYSGDDARTSK